jgi:urease accessory protein
MTRIHLSATPSGPATLRLAPGLLQPRTISRGARQAHVALVAGGAMLLGGDHVRVEIEVEDGCALEIQDVGGTVAYESRGTLSRMDVSIRLGEGAHLLWRAHPFVVTDGADVDRATRLEMGAHSTVLLRETLVLGRSGERGGRLRSAVRARDCDGTAVFIEDLALDGTRPRPGVLGAHRVLDSAMLLGRRAEADTLSSHGDHRGPAGPAPRLLHLERPGTIARSVAMDAHSTGIEEIMEEWASETWEQR